MRLQRPPLPPWIPNFRVLRQRTGIRSISIAYAPPTSAVKVRRLIMTPFATSSDGWHRKTYRFRLRHVPCHFHLSFLNPSLDNAPFPYMSTARRCCIHEYLCCTMTTPSSLYFSLNTCINRNIWTMQPIDNPIDLQSVKICIYPVDSREQRVSTQSAYISIVPLQTPPIVLWPL